MKEYIQTNRVVEFNEIARFASSLESEVVKEKPIYKLINGVCDSRYPVKDTLCYVESDPSSSMRNTLSTCCIVTHPKFAAEFPNCSLVLTDDPRALFIDILNWIDGTIGFRCFVSIIECSPMIHSEAEVHSSAILEEGVYVGAGSVISAGCVIKRGTCIQSNVFVRENTVIGCDGIALYKTKKGRVLRFPHLASVLIENGVEIGANCVIPRGVLRSSRIGEDSVIGNLTNIGHTVNVGKKVWMSVGCLVGGNSVIGDNVSFGLGTCIKDNLIIGKDCSVGMGSVVTKSLNDGVSVFGNPATPVRLLKSGPNR